MQAILVQAHLKSNSVPEDPDFLFGKILDSQNVALAHNLLDRRLDQTLSRVSVVGMSRPKSGHSTLGYGDIGQNITCVLKLGLDERQRWPRQSDANSI